MTDNLATDGDAMHGPISEADARAMVRLVGEAAGLEQGVPERKRYLMQGLCRLIDADVWMWSCAKASPDGAPMTMGFLHEGFTSEQLSAFVAANTHKDTEQIMEKFTKASLSNRPMTANITEAFNYDVYVQSECSDLLHQAGCGSGIIALFPMRELGEGYTSGIGVYRRPGQQPFTPREVRIAHIVLSEVRWLHKAGFTQDEEAATITPELTNRQRQVMALLLDGWGRKQIAHQIGISPNTVAGYIRDIYRHYNVGSHAELLRRFMAGDGNDRI